jgi:hypothetical protein
LSTGTGLLSGGICQALACLAAGGVEIRGCSGAAGFAPIPRLAQAAEVFLAQFALELPATDRFANNLAGGGVFSGIVGGLERSFNSFALRHRARRHFLKENAT